MHRFDSFIDVLNSTINDDPEEFKLLFNQLIKEVTEVQDIEIEETCKDEVNEEATNGQ